jgi:hypothetical protein
VLADSSLVARARRWCPLLLCWGVHLEGDISAAHTAGVVAKCAWKTAGPVFVIICWACFQMWRPTGRYVHGHAADHWSPISCVLRSGVAALCGCWPVGAGMVPHRAPGLWEVEDNRAVSLVAKERWQHE